MTLLSKALGFTLLEVLLSLALFSLIGLTTVRQITMIRNTKLAVDNQIEASNSLRAALSLIQKDLSQAFHVQLDDLGEETKSLVLKRAAIPHTLFDGRRDQLVFTSLSRRNFYFGRRESEQTEISYFLQDKKGTKGKTLYKRESPLIDGNLFEGGPVFSIIDNVTELEFKYWDDKTVRWEDNWNSDGTALLDRFPFAVKMKIKIKDSRSKELVMETSFKLSFPNNKPFLVEF